MDQRPLRATYEAPEAERYTAPGGPWDVPDLDTAFSTAAGDQPTGHALVDPSNGQRLDASALEACVASLAGGLRARGIRHGDVVAWQLPNIHESVLLFRACWRLGAVAAPLHHRAGAADLDAMLSALSPELLLACEGLPLSDNRDAITLRGASSSFSDLVDTGGEQTEASAAPEDPALVLFTSGSSGTPKAALHSHRGLVYKARRMAEVHGLTPDDCVLMPAPLAHISGLLNGVLIPGVVPLRTVLMDVWDPERALGLIEAEHVSFMIGPPTFFVTLLDTPGFDSSRVRSLRLVSSGGAGVTPAFVHDATRRLGARVKRTYGSTEAPTVTTSSPDDDEETVAHTDGRSTGDAELRIVDPDTGEERTRNEDGELWLRGPELFAGYLDASQTDAAVTDGWFRTGDLATLDDQDRLRIVGRLKDVVIRAGENISASEIEGLLEAHPAVRQAVVVGVPDDTLGERVVACVVADATFDLDACRAWFAECGVARFKTPEVVRTFDAFPLLAAGKPDRTALAEMVR